MSKHAYDPSLASAMGFLASTGVLVSHRIIMPGDEDALLPEERMTFRPSAPIIYRQSGAARIVARHLLDGLGFSGVALPRSISGVPVWPPGVTGSLAHDESVAVAAVARAREFSALGIDVEPAIPLPTELVNLVVTGTERRCYPASVIESRVLFAIKEAIYKALYPLDGLFLDFQDIEVDLHANRGQTRPGKTVTIAFIKSPRIVALAFSLHKPGEASP
jgi:4'-phosphopantetheinyl transferase EntD